MVTTACVNKLANTLSSGGEICLSSKVLENRGGNVALQREEEEGLELAVTVYQERSGSNIQKILCKSEQDIQLPRGSLNK